MGLLAELLACLQPLFLPDHSCFWAHWSCFCNVVVLLDLGNYLGEFGVVTTNRNKALNSENNWNQTRNDRLIRLLDLNIKKVQTGWERSHVTRYLVFSLLSLCFEGIAPRSMT